MSEQSVNKRLLICLLPQPMTCRHPRRGIAVQRYNNFCINANKNRFKGDFFSGGRKEYGVEVGSCAKRSLKFKV